MKKSQYFLIIIILIISILILVFFQLKKKSSSITTTTNLATVPADFFLSPDLNVSTSFDEVIFTGAQIITPQQLSTFNVSLEQLPEITSIVANICQINNSVEVSTNSAFYYGDVCNYYHPNKYLISLFSNNEDIGFPLPGLENPKANEEYFYSFLEQLYQNSDVFLPIDSHNENEVLPFSYYTNNYSYVNYSYHINNIPTSIHGKNIGLFSFAFLNNNFQSVTLPTFKLAINEQESFKTISTQQALANISSGNAYLLATHEYNQAIVSDVNYEDLTNVSLNSVALEYIVSETEAIAIPTYHFIGTARDRKGNQFGVEIVTPAINFTIAEPTPTPTP